MSIVVVGSIALDTIKAPKGLKENILGGSATYFSLAAHLFTPVKVVAVVGEDFPKNHIKLLKDKGIDLAGLEIKTGGKTFRWEGEYGQDLNNPVTKATYLNVFADFSPYLSEEYKQSKYLFLANIDPQVQARVLDQVHTPHIIASDTMNYWINNKPKELINLIKRINIFFINEAEAKQLSKEDNILKAADKILKFGPKLVVIKRGAYGVILKSKDFVFSSPAFLLEDFSDPTGAGDSFAGGFLGYLSSLKKTDKQALRMAALYGCVVASFTVEDFGINRLAKIKKEDLIKRFNNFKKMIQF